SLIGVGTGLITHQVSMDKLPEKVQPASAGAKPEKPEAKEQARRDLYGDPLPEGAISRIGTIRLWHGWQQYPLIYAPDGRMLASCDSGNAIRLWDAATGKEIRQIRPQGDFVRSLVFSPDGKTVITASFQSKSLK